MPTYSSEANPNREALLVSPNQRSNRDARRLRGPRVNGLVPKKVNVVAKTNRYQSAQASEYLVVVLGVLGWGQVAQRAPITLAFQGVVIAVDPSVASVIAPGSVCRAGPSVLSSVDRHCTGRSSLLSRDKVCDVRRP